MNDLDIALFEAWHRVAPRLLDDPEELKRRLARRKNKRFTHPLRAWCVALRASDHRLTDLHAIMVPRTALSLDSLDHPGRYAEHQVTLDKALLLRLCESVRIDAPGEPADHVAAKIGCFPGDLAPARRSGFLRTTPKPGLMGRRGKPVPLIYTPEYLDPQGRGRAGADDIFGCCWRTVPQLLPESFIQTITRIPRYQAVRGRERFVGWQWLCPSCRHTARTLFCPVDQPDLPTMLGFAPASAEPLPRFTPTFACGACHGIIAFSRTRLSEAWSNLILRCSGGLLYGTEVNKPDWLKPRRRQGYRRRKPMPAPRLDQLQHLLVATDLPYAQIAAQRGVLHRTIAQQAHLILKRHNVHSRAELKALLRPAQMPAARAG